MAVSGKFERQRDRKADSLWCWLHSFVSSVLACDYTCAVIYSWAIQ